MISDNLNTLKTIKKVEISDKVFDKIISRIATGKPKILSLYKAGIAASLILALILSEILLVTNYNKSSPQNSELITVNNNSLYNE